MNNLVDIQSQINALQKQATEIKMRDFDSTVNEIRTMMQLFGITFKDITALPRKQKKTKEGAEVVKSKPAPSTTGKTLEPKYRGPEGQAWSGRGLTPKWLATLMNLGAKREDFLIQKESSAVLAVSLLPELVAGL